MNDKRYRRNLILCLILAGLVGCYLGMNQLVILCFPIGFAIGFLPLLIEKEYQARNKN